MGIGARLIPLRHVDVISIYFFIAGHTFIGRVGRSDAAYVRIAFKWLFV
jgi:hypothetical protein